MVAALESDDVQVRSLAADGLAKLDAVPAGATEPLMRLTSDEDPNVPRFGAGGARRRLTWKPTD